MAQPNKVSNEHEVARKDLPFEFMLNALRLKEGVTLMQFLERTGLPLDALEVRVQAAAMSAVLKVATDDVARSTTDGVTSKVLELHREQIASALRGLSQLR